MQFYIGIDGGGSKTDFALGDATRELARAAAPSSKIQRVGREAAYDALQRGIDELLRKANVQRSEVSRSCIGISGGELNETRTFLARTLAQLLPGQNIIFGDHVIAHAAAFHGGPGVLVISGTGSIVYGVNEQSQAMRYGGRGPQISDEGSGYWIGRQAVSLAVSGDDFGKDVPLLAQIMQKWELTNTPDVIGRANQQPGPDFAALFPIVEKAAAAGDDMACEILRDAGRELAGLATTVIHRLWPGSERVRLAAAGGVIRNSSELRQSFERELTAKRGNLEFIQEISDPVLGALLIARKG